MFWFRSGNVGVLCELLHYIFGHGEVNILLLVVPFKVDATVEIAYAVFNNFIFFFAKGIVEVLERLSSPMYLILKSSTARLNQMG